LAKQAADPERAGLLVGVKMKKGFTLVELIVVIAIIAVLAGIVAIRSFEAIEKGKIASLMRDYKTIKTAAISYYSDTSTWPANNNASVSLVKSDGLSGWSGPYLESWPKLDPWSGNYIWLNDSAGIVAAAGIAERYLGITNVPSGSASLIDVDMDDGNVTTGFFRYSAANSTVSASVSDDSR
jgi:general secretion pathway protein G